MSLNRIPKFAQTVAFRLTLWYAGIFIVIVLGSFSLLYYTARSYVFGRVDDYLEAEIKESRVILASEGLEKIKTDIVYEENAHGDDKIFFRIVTPEDTILASSVMERWKHLDLDTADGPGIAGGKPFWTTVLLPEDRYQTRIIQAFIGPEVILQIGMTLKAEGEFMAVFRHIFAAVLISALLISIAVGWLMARKALSGVEDVTQTAISITGGILNQRVPVRGTADEIDRLAMVFNSMLDRIQLLITGMQEVNDNIAHDLRSPVTRIRGLAETTLTGEDSLNDYRNMAASTVEECDRLLLMINTMLDISEEEAGTAKKEISEVDLARMVREACTLYQAVAEEKGVFLVCEAHAIAPLKGDRKKLQRALSNLLENALKFTPPGGRITVSIEIDLDKLRIAVTDTGAGIPEDELPHIFKRFYRGRSSLSQPGSGLGLSLARAIVRTHGGDILVNSVPGGGSSFTLTLPRENPLSA
ncbi:MAG: ATP-binding protein [PVC group bacterium]